MPKAPAASASSTAAPSAGTDRTAIAARGQAASGRAPSQKAISATVARNVARTKATKRPPKPPEMAGPAADFGQRVSVPGPGGPQDPTDASAYWNDFLARLKNGESPKQIEESNVAKYGGTYWKGQGPEQVLSGSAYSAQVLQQYKGSPTLDNIDVLKSYDPKAWLAWLKKAGPAGYSGMASGQRDDAEYARILEAAQAAVANMKG